MSLEYEPGTASNSTKQLFLTLTTAQAHMARANTVEGSRANINEHYDLGNDMYLLPSSYFLNPTLKSSTLNPKLEPRTLNPKSKPESLDPQTLNPPTGTSYSWTIRGCTHQESSTPPPTRKPSPLNPQL